MAIEISPRSFRDLLSVAETRANLVPILADATQPQTYRNHVRPVDILYQDVAQRDQDSIFVRNLEFLRADGLGFLFVKARSVDVAARPQDVYARTRDSLLAQRLEVLDLRELDPFERDHAVLVVRRTARGS